MAMQTITVEMPDCAADHDAVALIVPLGIDTEFQRFVSFEAPKGWDATILAEPRSGQRAALLLPPTPTAKASLVQAFAPDGTQLSADAYRPEGTEIATAAAELASEARDICARAGGGLAGIAAIVADTSARFDYGQVPVAERWYYGQSSVPIIACAVGNCIDINTYLVAALRAAGFEASYLTCYFFGAQSGGRAEGMHCWVRTRHGEVTQDWDIAHFKKAGRSDVSAMLNPIPGQRFALGYGRDHTYPWRGHMIRLSTPSEPMWVREDGTVVWGGSALLQLS
jgi:transglutaminase-like putative cysteine protease